MSDKDVDAQFADIVAHWDEVALPPEDRLEGYAAEPTPGEPVAEPPGSASASPSAPPPTPAADELARGVNPPPELGFVVWRGATAPAGRDEQVAGQPHELDADDEDDHFVPGPTAPLPPQEDLQFWGIIVGLVAGPLLLLWLVIVRPAVSGWWTVGALGLTVGGFVLLVMRQPSTRDGDDSDDGARI